ncbi:protein COFACTOR ASSEMBLY OF COMPLEX C SUBUNIT B CCB2, chloroplastic isoform X2 [Magnolia sinica]|uniref:protein COFACTOR ASSEMBLY OF COMPLEX C SUBUNIT B CCB2, chloroplastic isoform X2 n=1 Tax=Magnolia sinica TaxID=86752 RepID=UPI002658BC96|nr:protein COFACTOR ASSEMBLY OF COMPLEX C SUBUNIT B CCB2, chloroplastic isoform X2 [Magnolia sinica]
MGYSSISSNTLQLFLCYRPRTKNPTQIHFSSSYLSNLRRRAKTTHPSVSASRIDSSSQEESEQQEKQLNLSVLRFTLGIPGFDESYLPRWIGYAFGSFILLNHFIGSDSVTPAQLRSEALGLCLAAFSISLPFLGRFLKGANPVDRSTLPEGNRQIFVMPENLSDTEKEDLAWVSYVLLRNTNTMSVLISVQDALCARGYWNVREDATKSDMLDWFKGQIQQIGFSDLKDTLYFPQGSDSQAWEILPNGALSLLVQPVLGAPNLSAGDTKNGGFVLLVSNGSYAYSDRDKAWHAMNQEDMVCKSNCGPGNCAINIWVSENNQNAYFSKSVND